ncbi:MAG: hypothetical protein KBD27_00690 [Candidatus Moranbacteria bacterium]|nr:hypothetical protein [Candidatus Moranbacteria bacterium]
MQFDTSKLYGGKCDIHAAIKPMDLPFLINHAFNWRNGAYEPEALQVVLARCYELFAEDITKPEQLRDVLMRTVKASGSDSGIFGLGKLPLDKLVEGRSYVSTETSIIGAKLRLRRYGDCLAIRPVNDRDETHEKVAGILDRIVNDGYSYMRRFIRRYSLGLTPDLKGVSGAYVLNVQEELATMNRYLPDIKWTGSKRLAADLGADFTGHERSGVKVGSYGDADIFARIVYDQEIKDQAWRQGKVRNTTGTELFFNSGAGDRPRIEYFIRMVERDSFDPARSDIDYQREQGLLHDLARMLYGGLYQRGFQSIVRNGNEHWIRFRREPEPAVV